MAINPPIEHTATMTNNHLQTAQECLNSLGIRHDLHESDGILMAQVQHAHVRLGLVVAAPQDKDCLRLMLLMPIVVPGPHRAAVGEFFLRLNFMLNVGAFELDFEDGEMRFRITHAISEQGLSCETVKRLLLTASSTVDGHWIPLMQILYASATPAQTIEQAEAFFRDYLGGPGKGFQP